ncbi:sugar phosphate nucleotidyltransferase, partial [Pseudomonas aeruginosa]
KKANIGFLRVLDPHQARLRVLQRGVGETQGCSAGACAAAVAEPRELAAQRYLVTFGITPERAETSCGYIEQGEPLGNDFRDARFVDKPDQGSPQSYLDSGKYLWNASK